MKVRTLLFLPRSDLTEGSYQSSAWWPEGADKTRAFTANTTQGMGGPSRELPEIRTNLSVYYAEISKGLTDKQAMDKFCAIFDGPECNELLEKRADKLEQSSIVLLCRT